MLLISVLRVGVGIYVINFAAILDGICSFISFNLHIFVSTNETYWQVFTL
jgi:hypothetical protein